MRRVSALTGIALVLASAGAATGGTNAGITGRVVSGPTCPVERVPPDPRCAPRPLQARVRISPVGRRGTSKTVKSDSNGRFRVGLAPGTYEVRGLRTNKSGLPRPPAPQRVTVSAGRFTRITLTYDTGIR